MAFWWIVLTLFLSDQLVELAKASQCNSDTVLGQSRCLKEHVDNEQKLLVGAVQYGTKAQLTSNQIKKLQYLTRLETVKSCRSAPRSGAYFLNVPNIRGPTTVQCVKSFLGGGWLVIQQRFDGSVNFDQPFQKYRDGFGMVTEVSEYWLGLEAIHQLTKMHQPCELSVEVRDQEGKFWYAIYSDFGVGDERTQYTMTRLGERKGTLNDALRSNALNAPFVTRDRDVIESYFNDKFATGMGGGWWFKKSWFSNLNGRYVGRKYNFYWDAAGSNLRYSRMMIRF